MDNHTTKEPKMKIVWTTRKAETETGRRVYLMTPHIDKYVDGRYTQYFTNVKVMKFTNGEIYATVDDEIIWCGTSGVGGGTRTGKKYAAKALIKKLEKDA
jgi:hypothetical protein